MFSFTPNACKLKCPRLQSVSGHPVARSDGLYMCLAVPGRVLTVAGADPAFRTGCVDFCGVRRTVSLAFTPEAGPGDFVLVHVGFAISRIDEEEAARAFRYLAEMGALAEEGIVLPSMGNGSG